MPNSISNAPVASLPVGAPNGDYLKMVGGLWTAATLNLVDLPLGQGVSLTELAGPDFQTAGLPGATAACRWVGATASGHPTSGFFVVGDFCIDHTGKVWICTVAGTPGTWVGIGPAAAVPTIQQGIVNYPANTGSIAVALPVAFVDASYSVVASVEDNANGTDMGLTAQCQRNTASSFNLQVSLQPGHTAAWAPPTFALNVEWIAVHA